MQEHPYSLGSKLLKDLLPLMLPSLSLPGLFSPGFREIAGCTEPHGSVVLGAFASVRTELAMARSTGWHLAGIATR